ncbi:MAG: FAD:protein FMN transferase, partial [Pseudonocardia sp.]|nr:FAD:protein FMN transferase [Pseudonocardia sp.]
ADAIAWLHWVDATFSTFRPDSAVSRLGRGEIRRSDCPTEVGHVLAWCERLAEETNGFFCAYAGGRLDPSGFVKGWAVERVSTMLADAGSRRHCVNGGGDVQCVGDAGDGRPWRIGIAHPMRPGKLVATIAGTGIAVATSGSAERGPHILDPHTNQPAHGLASVTVAGPHLTEADAYATVAFARGRSAPTWLNSLRDYSALIVTDDGAILATGALAASS